MYVPRINPAAIQSACRFVSHTVIVLNLAYRQANKAYRTLGVLKLVSVTSTILTTNA